jgi:hypothetical protein
MRRATILILLGVAILDGCAGVEPWVKPYEREHIADPIMLWNRDPIDLAYMNHVYEVREGSRGATGDMGGGCGCN